MSNFRAKLPFVSFLLLLAGLNLAAEYFLNTKFNAVAAGYCLGLAQAIAMD